MRKEQRYLVVGGFAINHHGFIRATEDIDIVVDANLENQRRVKKALEILPDKAILELGDDNFCDYTVVRCVRRYPGRCDDGCVWNRF